MDGHSLMGGNNMGWENDHRTYVADRPNPWGGDASGEEVFDLIRGHGLLPNHKLLDFGCGSLRIGRWLIPYLDSENYFGIEPNEWLVDAGKKEEIPSEVWEDKQPQFNHNNQFKLDVFETRFDMVLVSDILLHSADWQIERVIRGISKVSDTGIVDILPGENYEGTRWVYPGCVGHNDQCVTDIAEQEDFSSTLVEMPRGSSVLHWFILERDGTHRSN